MTICTTCGKSINTVSRECPYCHTRITMSSVADLKSISKQENDYDYKDNRILLVSVILPIVGIIYYVMKKEEYPIKASSALGGTLIGIVIIVIFVALYLLVNLFS